MAAPDPSVRDTVRLRPVPRWVAPVFAALGAATIPWTAYLAVSLPERADTHHYRIAWVGFNLMLVALLLTTAWLAWRGSRRVGSIAVSTATMLVVDAWFDVALSRPADVPVAVLSAVLLELPLAVVCGWIARHVDRVVERRLQLLARRAARAQAAPARSRRGRAAQTVLRRKGSAEDMRS